MSSSFVRITLIAAVALACFGCAAEPVAPPPAPLLEAISAKDRPAQPSERAAPTKGPLAKLAQAMREAEQETERAREALAKVKALTLDRDSLQEQLGKRTRERDTAQKLLAKTKKELRENMARLIDSEMERVRVEQELLRRKIEIEEKKRVEVQ